jgi:hypothetical protein
MHGNRLSGMPLRALPLRLTITIGAIANVAVNLVYKSASEPGLP